MNFANFTLSNWLNYLANNPTNTNIAQAYPLGIKAVNIINKSKNDLDIHVQNLTREIIKNVYTPSIFIQKLATNHNDAHMTITTLLTSSNSVQYGFTKLFMHGRLDLSIEALVLYPSVHAAQDFSFLFSNAVQTVAKQRLRGSQISSAW